MANSDLLSAVEQKKWTEVVRLLNESTQLGNTERCVTIDLFIKTASKGPWLKEYSGIVKHFTSQELERLMMRCMTDGSGDIPLVVVLNKADSETQGCSDAEESSKKFDGNTFWSEILPQCRGDQLDDILNNLVTRRKWQLVGLVLQKGVSDDKHRWAVEEASKTAAGSTFQKTILPHCKVDQFETLLTHLVPKGAWGCVKDILAKGVCDSLQRWVVEEASKTAKDLIFERSILPYCKEDQLEAVLTHLVKRECWGSVEKVLTKGVGDETQRWAVEAASKTANDSVFEKSMLQFCKEDQYEMVLKHLVAQGSWSSVEKVLTKVTAVSDVKRRWVVEEASKTAKDSTFEKFLLHQCKEDQYETVLRHLVRRGLWRSVDKMLRKEISHEQRKWAVEEASKTAEKSDFFRLMFYHCSDDQLPDVLIQLESRLIWKNDGDFRRNVLNHFSKDQLDSVLVHLVKKGMWQSVGVVLTKGVSAENHHWAVDEASRNTSDCSFMSYIVDHCRQDQLDAVLTILVQRSFWWSVDKILQKGVTAEKHTWAIVQASRMTDDETFKCHFVKHCNKDNLGTTLTCLVTRNMWRSVVSLLNRGVTDKQLKQVAEEASKTASEKHFESYIVPYCSEELLLSILPNLEIRGLFRNLILTPHEISTGQNSLHVEVSHGTMMRVKLVYQLAKGADPFKLAKDGGSVLFYAAINNICPDEAVAKCIQLGFSTHQPALSGTVTKDKILQVVKKFRDYLYRNPATSLKSPFVYAVVKDIPEIANMLYESGACSNAELFCFYKLLEDAKDPQSEDGKKLRGAVGDWKYKDVVKTAESLSPTLTEMATTPHSLMSLCRLVISHCLKVSATRIGDVQQLPLADKMKNYVLFTDLTDSFVCNNLRCDDQESHDLFF